MMREGFARGRTKRPKDIALGAATVVDLLSGSLGRPGVCLHQGLTCIALGAHRSHFVETDHTAARRRGGVERFDVYVSGIDLQLARAPPESFEAPICHPIGGFRGLPLNETT